MSTSSAAPGLSVCVLAGDDPHATAATVSAARPLGPVVVAVPAAAAPALRAALAPPVPAPRSGGVAPAEHDRVSVVEVGLDRSVAEAWQLALAAARHDTCLLLHAGEVVVTPPAGPREVFSAATVVEQTDAVAGPDRLDAVRLVDRRRCRLSGTLRPVIQVEQGTAAGTAPGATVVVDLGARVGPDHGAWLQYLGRHLDTGTDPAELVDLAAMLAATGETDAAAVRLLDLHGALAGDLGRRAARMLAVLAQRHARRLECELAVQEWERLGGTCGPALAVRALALLQARRPAQAADLLERALDAGLVDDDGVSLDRDRVLAARHQARSQVQRSAERVAAALQHPDDALAGDVVTHKLMELWLRSGQAPTALLERLGDRRGERLLDVVLRHPAAFGGDVVRPLVEHLWPARPDVTVTLLGVAAMHGWLELGEAVDWSRRLRAVDREAGCPLPLMAAAPVLPPVLRVLAAAALVHDLGDRRGVPLLQGVSLLLHPAAVAGATRRLRVQAPRLEQLLGV